MALAADLQLPSFTPPLTTGGRAVLWIASDEPPLRAQSWPVLVPIPAGWHEVSQQEAEQIEQRPVTALSFVLVGPPTDDLSEAVALSSSPPEEERRRQGRPPREPRSPRAPRAPRAPRTVRESRLFRSERAPRPARKARPPRSARPPRKPRQPRPRAYKSYQKPGVCKGPGCTCWTPAGCIGAWYLEALYDFQATECYRGPCYSYELCVSDKCNLHLACTVQTILQFWARQYRAVVTYVVPRVEAAVAPIRAALVPVPAAQLPPGELPPVEPPAPVGYQAGCPPGWYWTIGLTGCRCTPPEFHLPPATREQVIACLGYDPGTGFLPGT